MAKKEVSVLVVEDDPDLHDIILDFLEDEEYYVRGAKSAEEAYKLVDKVKFDLLLTDVRLPGCDGVEGFVQLKRQAPALRCVIMTGYADDDIPVKALRSHVDDYLYKPFKLHELARVVRRVTGQQNLAAHYFEMLQQVPSRLFQACRGFFANEATLDKARSQAFIDLYVAIRSKLLMADAANAVLSKLFILDDEHKDYLANPNSENRTSLTESYLELSRFMTAISRSGGTVLGGDRLKTPQFRCLYSAVQKGDITPEQMQLAPSLLRANKEALAQVPELLALRAKMWTS
jgi:DNA-binding response OmpR family regulator